MFVAVVVILLLVAVAFGIGAVLEGLAWMFLIVVALIAVAAWVGWRKLRGGVRRSLGGA